MIFLPEIPGLYLKLAAIAVALVAAFCDLRTHKIPNKLTFPASAAGIICQAFYFASWANTKDIFMQFSAGFASGICGWFMGVFIMSITKLFMRKFGHGDTKLVAALGSFLGPWMVLLVYFYYSLCFGAFSILRLVATAPWQQLLMAFQLKSAGVEAPKVDMEKLQDARKEIIPVAPFICLGLICAVVFESQTLEFLGFHDD